MYVQYNYHYLFNFTCLAEKHAQYGIYEMKVCWLPSKIKKPMQTRPSSRTNVCAHTFVCSGGKKTATTAISWKIVQYTNTHKLPHTHTHTYTYNQSEHIHAHLHPWRIHTHPFYNCTVLVHTSNIPNWNSTTTNVFFIFQRAFFVCDWIWFHIERLDRIDKRFSHFLCFFYCMDDTQCNATIKWNAWNTPDSAPVKWKIWNTSDNTTPICNMCALIHEMDK